MKAAMRNRAFTILPTILLLISVFAIAHAGLSLRLRQSDGSASRALIVSQAHWLASSAVEETLAAIVRGGRMDASDERVKTLTLAPVYLGADPLTSSEEDRDTRPLQARSEARVSDALQLARESFPDRRIERAVMIEASASVSWRGETIMRKAARLAWRGEDGTWRETPVAE
ncbi:MAG: hypothetical protein GC154_14675 [bacterium]|nr:hypothetical protein [bacterium]